MDAVFQPSSRSELGPYGGLRQKDVVEDVLLFCFIGSAQTMPREILESPPFAHDHLKLKLDANISPWTSTVFRDGRWMQTVKEPEALCWKPWLCRWLHSP